MRRVELIGIVGERVELKSVGDKSVLNFSVVANGTKKDEDGIWHSCALWGARAEKLSDFIKKGKKMFVRGEYRLRKWEKGEKSGVDVEVNVDELELLSPKEESKSDW